MDIYKAASLARAPMTLGRVFIVSPSNGASYQSIIGTWLPDREYTARNYTTVTDALAACTTGRGDVIVTTADFTTALTAAELLAAETKGVTFYHAGPKATGGSDDVTFRATSNLPQSTSAPIFTSTGRIQLVAINGEITTALQAQTNNMKLIATPTVGTAGDLCATSDTNGFVVGRQLFITGTLATGLQTPASGISIYQATSLIVKAGTIDLSCSASSTGAIKWRIQYRPIDPGARVFAA